MANSILVHKVRNPNDSTHWITDWTATIEENDYSITPSDAWRIPVDQLVGNIPIDRIAGFSSESQLIETSIDTTGLSGIPILSGTGISDLIQITEDTSNTLLAGDGTWKTINNSAKVISENNVASCSVSGTNLIINSANLISLNEALNLNVNNESNTDEEELTN